MKTKHLITALLVAGSQLLFAQSEFKKSWETKVKVENTWNACNSDLSLVLIGDPKTFSMIDGTNGKILWTINAKEKYGVKEVEDWTFMIGKEGEPVEVIYKKPKSDATTKLYLDPRTGAPLAETEFADKKEKTKKSKSKTMFASEAYDENATTWVEVTFEDKKVKSATDGGTEMNLTVKATGTNTWSTPMKARCTRHLCNILLSSDEPTMMVNVMTAHGKVFVVYEGITVLDIQTGKVLWTTSFDNIDYDGGMKSVQTIGRCPMPVATEEAVYICDLSKGERAIKKLDINTGKVMWKGEKLSSDDIISQLFVSGDVLLAKFGGVVRSEIFVASSGGVGAGTYKVEYTYEGNTDVKAMNAETGKLIWNAETAFKDNKLGKSECSIMLNGENLVVCSDKSLLLVDPKTGKVGKKEDLGTKEIGKAQRIFVYNDNFIVEGNEGIASFTTAGKKNYATSTDKCLMSEFKHDAYIVWTGKEIGDMNEFIRFDLESGKILGSLEGCYRPRFDNTGDYFVRFNEQTVTKYKTKL